VATEIKQLMLQEAIGTLDCVKIFYYAKSEKIVEMEHCFALENIV